MNFITIKTTVSHLPLRKVSQQRRKRVRHSELCLSINIELIVWFYLKKYNKIQKKCILFQGVTTILTLGALLEFIQISILISIFWQTNSRRMNDGMVIPL